MKADEKKAKLEGFAPRIWDMYKHLSDGRSKLEEKLGYFLAIDTLFMVAFLQLFEDELKTLSFVYVVPFLLLLAPVLIMLVEFFPMALRSPWLEREQIAKSIANDTILVDWLSGVFSCAYGSFQYMKSRSKLLRNCLRMVGIAILWMATTFVIELCTDFQSDTDRIIVMVAFVIFVVGVTYLIGKKSNEPSQADRGAEVREFFSDWIGNVSSDTEPQQDK